MDLAALEREVASIDAALAPIAQAPVDVTDPDWMTKLRQAAPAIERAGVPHAPAVLRTMIEAYATGDEATRVAIRDLLERYSSFRWGVHLPDRADTPDGFRLLLLHLSARDQVPDTRDELLALRDLCAEATAAGVDTEPIMAEVAGLSSDVDRYGWGSTRKILDRSAAS